MITRRKRMAVVRPYKPNLAELAIYKPFLEEWEVAFYYTGISEQQCRIELDTLGLDQMRIVRYRGYTDFLPRVVQRPLDFKIGLGSLMLSHLGELTQYDVVNVVDPIYAHVHQIVNRLRPQQKLVIVRWENIPGRYDKIWLAKRFASKALKRADVVICTSDAALRALIDCESHRGHAVRIYPGIDMSRLGGRRAFGERRIPAILFVGRGDWGKGLSYLLAAFRMLKELHFSDVELWVAGVNEIAFAHVVEKLEIANSVKFLGRLSNNNVRVRMNKAAVVCVPSVVSPTWAEQFGYVVVEAMAAGVPVVAFDSGCLREICGKDGYFAATGNAWSLAEALTQALSSPREAESRGARLRIRAMETFDALRQGEKMLACITRVLDSSRHSLLRVVDGQGAEIR